MSRTRDVCAKIAKYDAAVARLSESKAELQRQCSVAAFIEYSLTGYYCIASDTLAVSFIESLLSR